MMTEEEWLLETRVDSLSFDIANEHGNSPRKIRLFATACCRRATGTIGDRQLNQVVDAIEHFADGRLSKAGVQKLRDVLQKLRVTTQGDEEFGMKYMMRQTVSGLRMVLETNPQSIIWSPAYVRRVFAPGPAPRSTLGPIPGSGNYVPSPETLERLRLEEAENAPQLKFLRDIFGNPFRPVAFDPAWRTSTAIGLATTMYDSRNFNAMPILADALQDAGCENEHILTHCRDEQQVHVRGCWVIDLVLGKS